MKIYFAHPVNTYNTPIEKAVLTLLARTFPDWIIENPNQPRHQAGYANYAKRAHKGMDYFTDHVLPLCGAVAAMPYLDNRLGLGVAGETNWLAERDKPAYMLEVPSSIAWADFEDFTHDPFNGFFRTRPFLSVELAAIREKNPKIVVPHEETRLRTWIIYNRILRNYDGAHLVSMPLPDNFYQQ